MSETESISEPICIVSMGGLFPGALSTDEFWKKILNGERAFKPLKDLFWTLHNPQEINRILNSNKNDPFYVRTDNVFQFSDEEIDLIKKRNNLESNCDFRDLLLIDLLRQNNYPHITLAKKKRKQGIVLGLSGTGFNVTNHRKEESLRQWRDQCSSPIQQVATRRLWVSVVKAAAHISEPHRSGP